MMDAALGALVQKLDRWARGLKKKRCAWFGHSYRNLGPTTWNCHKCGKLKLLR